MSAKKACLPKSDISLLVNGCRKVCGFFLSEGAELFSRVVHWFGIKPFDGLKRTGLAGLIRMSKQTTAFGPGKTAQGDFFPLYGQADCKQEGLA